MRYATDYWELDSYPTDGGRNHAVAEQIIEDREMRMRVGEAIARAMMARKRAVERGSASH